MAKKSDKNVWFISNDTKSLIHCTMDSLEDLLCILFKGDWRRARRTARIFRPVTHQEYIEYELDKNL